WSSRPRLWRRSAHAVHAPSSQNWRWVRRVFVWWELDNAMSLRIDGLRKRFGEVQALDGVSFTVARGEVFGFLGANGAGKTTTMRIVLGLLHADEGSVAWLDRAVSAWPRRTWGYMPEER